MNMTHNRPLEPPIHIPFTDTITSGEASDLIGRATAERERRKAAATREASKETTQCRKKGRASA